MTSKKTQISISPYNTKDVIRSNWWLEKYDDSNKMQWKLYIPVAQSGGAPTKEPIIQTSYPGVPSKDAQYVATRGAEQSWSLTTHYKNLDYISEAEYNNLIQTPDWSDLQNIPYNTAISYVEWDGDPIRSMWDMYHFAITHLEGQSLTSTYKLYEYHPVWGADVDSTDIDDYPPNATYRDVFLDTNNPSFKSGAIKLDLTLNFKVGQNALSNYIGILEPPNNNEDDT